MLECSGWLLKFSKWLIAVASWLLQYSGMLFTSQDPNVCDILIPCYGFHCGILLQIRLLRKVTLHLSIIFFTMTQQLMKMIQIIIIQIYNCSFSLLFILKLICALCTSHTWCIHYLNLKQNTPKYSLYFKQKVHCANII